MAAESGLRSHVLMQLNYGHVKEDIENGTTPVVVRLEPRFYVGKKAAGYSFLGDGSVRLIQECLKQHFIEETSDSRLIPRSYYSISTSIQSAKRVLGLDPKIQTSHGFRKYFENALDEASIDHENQMLIEEHFAGTRAKHYTDRDIERLREVYRRAYPFIRVSLDDPIHFTIDNNAYNIRLEDLEARIDRQRIIEAQLTALEDELAEMREFRKRIE